MNEEPGHLSICCLNFGFWGTPFLFSGKGGVGLAKWLWNEQRRWVSYCKFSGEGEGTIIVSLARRVTPWCESSGRELYHCRVKRVPTVMSSVQGLLIPWVRWRGGTIFVSLLEGGSRCYDLSGWESHCCECSGKGAIIVTPVYGVTIIRTPSTEFTIMVPALSSKLTKL